MNKKKIPSKTELKKYYKTKHWETVRKKRLSKDNCRCQNCGKKATAVHHRNYKRLYNERMDDLISLCASCHIGKHTKKREDIKLKKYIKKWRTYEKRQKKNTRRIDQEKKDEIINNLTNNPRF